MNLWLFDIDEFPESKMELAYSCLPETMSEVIARYRLLDDRKSRLIARIMIQKFTEEQFGTFDWDDWSIDRNGKPYLVNGPFFNISHSGKKIVVAFSMVTEVGVDIEKITDVKTETLSVYLHPDEITYLKSNNFDRRLFFWIWSRKEAFLKTVGIGLLEGLNQFSVFEPIHYMGNTVYLNDIEIMEDYSFSVGSAIEDLIPEVSEITSSVLVNFIEKKGTC